MIRWLRFIRGRQRVFHNHERGTREQCRRSRTRRADGFLPPAAPLDPDLACRPHARDAWPLHKLRRPRRAHLLHRPVFRQSDGARGRCKRAEKVANGALVARRKRKIRTRGSALRRARRRRRLSHWQNRMPARAWGGGGRGRPASALTTAAAKLAFMMGSSTSAAATSSRSPPWWRKAFSMGHQGISNLCHSLKVIFKEYQIYAIY
ncbi:unnamed protein product [Urochloa humidicola]